MTITGLQGAMVRGRLTAIDAVEHYLRRIQRLDPLLHAVLAVDAAAHEQAADSDARRAAGRLRGPLDGIPVLVKDNIDTVGGPPTTAGSLALAEHHPGTDAVLVQQLRAAGAVLLGKANLSEWANFRSTHSRSGWSALGGQTANAHVLDRNPSGSSSGSAVAVAAGLAAAAIGTETDGSIISPAAHNGVVGLKPTVGLVSRTGIIPISIEQDTAGPITLTVADAAALLAVLIDPDQRPAGSVPADYSGALDADSLRGSRIGLWRAGATGPVRHAVDAAAAALTGRGAVVVEVDLPYQQEIEDTEILALHHEFKAGIDGYLAGTMGPQSLAELIAFNEEHATQELPLFGQETFLAAQATTGLSSPDYLRARQIATDRARRSIDETLAEHDLVAIVAPSNSPAERTDADDPAVERSLSTSTSTPAAVAGYPSLTVPMGMAGPLPLGLSFIGPAGTEARLLSLAHAFERAAPARRAARLLPSYD